MDIDATRTYHVDERLPLRAALSGDTYASVFAQNYDSPFLLYPFTQPHGASKSGLMTFSALGITDRFMGEEPFSPSTAIYNEEVKARLEKDGTAVHILPRLEKEEKAVSASEVRSLLAEGKTEDALRLLPETTAAYIKAHESEVREWVRRRQ